MSVRALVVAVVLLGGTAGAAPKNKPTLSHHEPMFSDANTPPLTKVIERSDAKLLACYKKALVLDPELSGTATVQFTIAADGKVTTVETTGLTVTADACISATFTKLRFSKRKGGQPVKVTYPLTFDRGPDRGVATRMVGLSVNAALRGPTIDSKDVGLGSGVGSGRPSPPVPSSSLGKLVVQGDLDPAIVRRSVKRHIQKLVYCYEKELTKTPTLKGTVNGSFTIGVDGLVSASTASGLGNPTVETCVAGVLKNAEFPKPAGSKPVIVTYPLSLFPVGSAPDTK